MAVRDYSIDDKLIKAAKEEFFEFGFEKASLRKIAQKAGITTGALYTRYQSKDVLFASLVDGLLTKMKEESSKLNQNYQDATLDCTEKNILAAIQTEESFYIDLLKHHYEECILFFCRSDGSSICAMLQAMLQKKASETVKYLKSIAKKEIDYNGIEVIMMEQFHLFKQILNKGLNLEETISALRTAEDFLDEGWKATFKQIL